MTSAILQPTYTKGLVDGVLNNDRNSNDNSGRLVQAKAAIGNRSRYSVAVVVGGFETTTYMAVSILATLTQALTLGRWSSANAAAHRWVNLTEGAALATSLAVMGMLSPDSVVRASKAYHADADQEVHDIIESARQQIKDSVTTSAITETPQETSGESSLRRIITDQHIESVLSDADSQLTHIESAFQGSTKKFSGITELQKSVESVVASVDERTSNVTISPHDLQELCLKNAQAFVDETIRQLAEETLSPEHLAQQCMEREGKEIDIDTARQEVSDLITTIRSIGVQLSTEIITLSEDLAIAEETFKTRFLEKISSYVKDKPALITAQAREAHLNNAAEQEIEEAYNQLQGFLQEQYAADREQYDEEVLANIQDAMHWMRRSIVEDLDVYQKRFDDADDKEEALEALTRNLRWYVARMGAQVGTYGQSMISLENLVSFFWDNTKYWLIPNFQRLAQRRFSKKESAPEKQDTAKASSDSTTGVSAEN